MTIPERKRALRTRMRRALRALTPEDRASASERLVAGLVAEPRFVDAAHVGLFVALADEPDLTSLLAATLDLGKRLWLPKMLSPQTGYIWAEVRSLTRDLEPGAYGILEPGAKSEKKPPNRLDFVLIPGLAFSVFGARLGRGKGYYDRLAPTIPGWKAGVAFDFQITDEIPTETHDVFLERVYRPSDFQKPALGLT